MKYKKLGSTDIDVSLIALGTMTWGEQNTQKEGFEQMDYAVERGINFFDTAEMYPVPPKPETSGSTEKILGEWLNARGSRDKIFLATKVTGRASRNSGMDHIRSGPRLSQKHIFEAVEGSLKRLQTDYIDLYQIHWPERSANFFGKLGYEHDPSEDGIATEETLQALDTLVKQGKIRHVGLSNETAWGMHEYLRLSREQDLSRIVSIQNPYNLLNRSFDVGSAEMAIREKVNLLAYSPLAFGALSGKYLNGERPAGARLTLYTRFARYLNEYAQKATKAYVELARKHDLDPSQMALAFVNSRPAVATNIIGATSMEQLRCNIDSVDIVLPEEVKQGIEDIHLRYSNPAP